jgi:hypothetical protein
VRCEHCGAAITTDVAVCVRCGWRPPAPKPQARVTQPGELLFEFVKGYTRIRCELVDHGDYGVEARILHDEEPMIGSSRTASVGRSARSTGPSRTMRSLAPFALFTFTVKSLRSHRR